MLNLKKNDAARMENGTSQRDRLYQDICVEQDIRGDSKRRASDAIADLVSVGRCRQRTLTANNKVLSYISLSLVDSAGVTTEDRYVTS